MVLFTTLVGGLKYPTLAASFGGMWLFGRVVYTIGYSSGNPAKVCTRPILSSRWLIFTCSSATVVLSIIWAISA
jgi:MAPEG family